MAMMEQEMPSRLTLICQGATTATRRAAFPDDEPLEGGSLSSIHELGPTDWRFDSAWVSPMRAACQTADALSLNCTEDSRLRDLDYGTWAGRTIAEIESEEPGKVELWTREVDFNDHGGESIAMLLKRVDRWLNRQPPARGRFVAITHAAVIRAAIVSLLGASSGAFWRVDIAPLTLTDLRHDGRRWALRSCGTPLAGGGAVFGRAR